MSKNLFTLCALSLALIGCSDSSSGSSDGEKVCSVSKTANSVTVNSMIPGGTNYSYEFDESGNMVSQVSVFDYSAKPEAEAEKDCRASGVVAGFTSNYEGGKCTVTQTVGLAGTLDQIFQEQSVICDELNDAANNK
jgi:hypothetical protein